MGHSTKKFKDRIDWLHRTVDRFWSKVDRRGPDECWPWQGTKQLPNPAGMVYGSFGVTDRDRCVSYRAHRFAWMVTNGEIPEDHVVMHTCDNPICVNPAHLKAGTRAENNKDMRDKGRDLVGSQHPNAKLTEIDVFEILESDEPYQTIADRFGLDYTKVMRIKRGDSWRHVYREFTENRLP